MSIIIIFYIFFSNISISFNQFSSNQYFVSKYQLIFPNISFVKSRITNTSIKIDIFIISYD